MMNTGFFDKHNHSIYEGDKIIVRERLSWFRGVAVRFGGHVRFCEWWGRFGRWGKSWTGTVEWDGHRFVLRTANMSIWMHRYWVETVAKL